MPQPKDKDWLNGYKNRTPTYVVYKRPTSKQGTHTTESEGLEKDFPCKQGPKESRSSNTQSDKIDFKTKAVKRDKDVHYTMIKGSIQEEDKTIINIYAPNTGAPQYVRQMLTSMKGEINNNTIIVGDFNIPLTPMDSHSNQDTKTEIQMNGQNRKPRDKSTHLWTPYL